MPLLRTCCRLLSTLVLLACAVAAPAADNTLYEAAVAVQGQGGPERARATADGLRQVLVKVSGQRSVLDLPAVKADLGRADALLASYRYETAPQATGAPAGAGDVPLRLRLVFDGSGVLALLNRAGAPVWGPSRPKTYLSILRDAAGGRVPVSLGMPQADLLLDAAVQRGIPVVLPGPEPLGLPAGSGGDPAAGLPADVSDAAQRNGARVALAAALSGSPGNVRAVGTLGIEGDTGRVDVVAADEASALRELLNVVADRVGARYAVVARQDQFRGVRFRVAGVKDVAALAGLERWLSSLPLVKDLVVERVGADHADFAVMVAGEVPQFLQALRIDGRFATVGEPAADGAFTVVDATLK